jgi:hypothetical protein
MKNLRKYLCLALALVLAFGLLPGTAAAASTITPGGSAVSGTLTWGSSYAEYVLPTMYSSDSWGVELSVTVSGTSDYEIWLTLYSGDYDGYTGNYESQTEDFYPHNTNAYETKTANGFTYKSPVVNHSADRYKYGISIPEYMWEDMPSNARVSYSLKLYKQTTSNSGFIDVNPGDWFYDYVVWGASNRLIEGVGDNRFSPNGTLTRAQFITILARYAYIDATDYAMAGYFDDCDDSSWYGSNVTWAYENGIADATGYRRFSPHANIPRQDLVIMLYRYFKYVGKDVSVSNPNILNSYTDRGSLSTEGRSAFAWAIENGIISGVGDNRLSPHTTATRAQASKIFMISDEVLHSTTPNPPDDSYLRPGTYVCYEDSWGQTYNAAYRPVLTINADASFSLYYNTGEGMDTLTGICDPSLMGGPEFFILKVQTPTIYYMDTYLFHIETNGDVKLLEFLGVTPENSVFERASGYQIVGGNSNDAPDGVETGDKLPIDDGNETPRDSGFYVKNTARNDWVVDYGDDFSPNEILNAMTGSYVLDGTWEITYEYSLTFRGQLEYWAAYDYKKTPEELTTSQYNEVYELALVTYRGFLLGDSEDFRLQRYVSTGFLYEGTGYYRTSGNGGPRHYNQALGGGTYQYWVVTTETTDISVDEYGYDTHINPDDCSITIIYTWDNYKMPGETYTSEMKLFFSLDSNGKLCADGIKYCHDSFGHMTTMEIHLKQA